MFVKKQIIIVGLFCISLLAQAQQKMMHIQHWKTDNGVPVYFVKATELPMIDVHVVFDAGSSRDGHQFGLANFTHKMINQGSKTQTANQIAEGFDDVGANYTGILGRDMSTLGFRSLSDPQYFTPALKTFLAVLAAPTFPQRAFRRVKIQLENALRYQHQNPQRVGGKAFFKALYGQQPYGHPVLGTRKAIRGISRRDLKHFYNRFYVAQNAMIAMVGNITLAHAKAVAQQVASTLRMGDAPPVLPMSSPLHQLGSKDIRFPSKQTHIFIGQIGINFHSPDYFPLMVGNDILGGGQLTSRLFYQVREKRGLAYSVGSFFQRMRDRGPFALVLQTRNSQAQEALRVSLDALKAFVAKGPTQEELTLTKSRLKGSFPLKIASNAAILSHIMMMGFYHVPLDYLDRYIQRVDAVTIKDINAAFHRNLHLDKMTIVTIGNGAHPK